MCRFISIGLEEEGEAKRIFAGYSLWQNENKSFLKQLEPGFHGLWVTDAHCSCAFYSDPYDPDLEAEKLRKEFSKTKYRKKGWSQERIEREVQQALKRPNNRGGLSELLFDCLCTYSREFGPCYFHVGWYSGDQTRQCLQIEDRIELSISTGAGNASQVHENTLYQFS